MRRILIKIKMKKKRMMREKISESFKKDTNNWVVIMNQQTIQMRKMILLKKKMKVFNKMRR